MMTRTTVDTAMHELMSCETRIKKAKVDADNAKDELVKKILEDDIMTDAILHMIPIRVLVRAVQRYRHFNTKN